MSKAFLLAALLALSAGCVDVPDATGDGEAAGASSEDEHTFSSQTSMTHNFANGETQESTFGMSGPGTLTYEVVFTVGVSVAGAVVCPVQDTDVKVEVVGPDGSVVDTFTPDARGVMGNGRCGGGSGAVESDEAGQWTMRFSGQAEVSAQASVTTQSR